MCFVYVCGHAWLTNAGQNQEGARLMQNTFFHLFEFLFVQSEGLSYCTHSMFTLEFKQSWNQVWHSLCSICLTGVFVVCVCVGEREKRKGVQERERYGILLDGLTHIQAHLHTVLGMVRQRFRQTRHTIIAVPKDLDPHAFIFLKERHTEKCIYHHGLWSKMINIFIVSFLLH